MKKNILTILLSLCLAISLLLTSCDRIQNQQGEKGEPGQNGTKVTIGENGNWFLDGIDTGIKASGECDCNCSENEKPQETRVGVMFSDAHECLVEEPFSTVPTTYEAWIKCPKNYSDRAGVIFGNYDDVANQIEAYFSFEIYTNGNPRLYFKDVGKDGESVIFDKVNACTGEWLHLTIINDYDNDKSYCYIDGELMQEKSAVKPIETISSAMVGNDFRTSSKRSFKGEIHSIALYGDIRTPEEIQEDKKTYGQDGMLAGWEFCAIPADGKIVDLSGNGHYVQWIWITEKAPVEDFAYSFVVVGDTQSVNIYDPNNFSTIYDWIIENKEDKKIEYVIGLGDITDKDQVEEWNRASAAFEKLDKEGIGYSLVRGNHDSSARFNATFNKQSYTQSFDGQYGTTLESTYRKIEVCGIKYLIFTLDFGATDNILNWASEIIENHPDYNVIITTHAYLYRDGTTIDKNDIAPPTKYNASNNNGDEIWNKLVSKHKNIVLVLSGHDPHPRVVCTQTAGENGNIVTQILSDHQYVDRDMYKAGMDTTGMVTLLHFSADGTRVVVETYSTVYGMYYGHYNQFEFTLNVIK